LGDREHLAVALDRPRAGLPQLMDALAQLLIAGVEVNHEPLWRVLPQNARCRIEAESLSSMPIQNP